MINSMVHQETSHCLFISTFRRMIRVLGSYLSSMSVFEPTPSCGTSSRLMSPHADYLRVGSLRTNSGLLGDARQRCNAMRRNTICTGIAGLSCPPSSTPTMNMVEDAMSACYTPPGGVHGHHLSHAPIRGGNVSVQVTTIPRSKPRRKKSAQEYEV